MMRLKVIEQEENERVRKKREAEHEFNVQTSRLRELMAAEIQHKFQNYDKSKTTITTTECCPT